MSAAERERGVVRADQVVLRTVSLSFFSARMLRSGSGISLVQVCVQADSLLLKLAAFVAAPRRINQTSRSSLKVARSMAYVLRRCCSLEMNVCRLASATTALLSKTSAWRAGQRCSARVSP